MSDFSSLSGQPRFSNMFAAWYQMLHHKWVHRPFPGRDKHTGKKYMNGCWHCSHVIMLFVIYREKNIRVPGEVLVNRPIFDLQELTQS